MNGRSEKRKEEERASKVISVKCGIAAANQNETPRSVGFLFLSVLLFSLDRLGVPLVCLSFSPHRSVAYRLVCLSVCLSVVHYHHQHSTH
jgi:hypothetical protein